MKASIIVMGISLALPGCHRGNDESKREEGTDRSITMNKQSAKPARDATEADRAERDRAAVNADDQGESEADLGITQQVRQAMMKQDGLSMEAKNVQVITKNGVVTLRGDVKNASEKALLSELAQGAPGVVRIDNQLAINPKE